MADALPTRVVFSRLAGMLSIAALLVVATPAMAGPLDDSHVGSLGFSGPTTGDVAAVYWNPAALGLLKGNQFMAGGSLHTTSVTVDRTAIDPATGAPGGTRVFPSASGHGLEQPFAWPIGPTGFLGVGAEVAGRFALAIAAYTPFAQNLSFNMPAGGEQPATRYHLVTVSAQQFALATGLAVQLSDWLQVGVASGLLFSYGHLVFDEDTALGNPSASCDVNPAQPSCGVENPQAAARYDLASRGTQAPSIFVAGGIQYRRAAWDVGFAYTSAPLGTGGMVNLTMEQSQVTPPPSAGVTDLCSALGHAPCVSSEMQYRLPDIFTAGVTWHATPHLAAVGIVRWLRYSSYNQIGIRLIGPSNSLLGSRLPDQLALYRGFQDSWDTRARLVHSPLPWLRWSGTLRMETSAVPTSNVTAAAVDGLKIEPVLATELALGRHLHIEVGYALTWMLPVTVDASVFDPSAAATCAQAGGDLSTPACQIRRAGQARPTAAGRYQMLQQTLAVMTTLSF